jgi:hypothetical protein
MSGSRMLFTRRSYHERQPYLSEEMKMQSLSTFVTGLVLASVVLAACVAVPTTAPPTLPTALPTALATVATPLPLFGRAGDWSWVAGRVLPTMQPSACLLLQYDPSNKDGTGGTIPLALPAGTSADGFIVVHGAAQAGTGTLCEREARVFVATRVDLVSMPVYGHADDYSWVAGQYQKTRIQGGCIFIIFDPQAGAPQGGRFVIGGNAQPAADGSWVILYGKLNTTEPKEMCPGTSYWADRLELQTAGANASHPAVAPAPGP